MSGVVIEPTPKGSVRAKEAEAKAQVAEISRNRANPKGVGKSWLVEYVDSEGDSHVVVIEPTPKGSVRDMKSRFDFIDVPYMPS